MAENQMQILIATTNAGKVRELTELFGKLPFLLRNLSEFPQAAVVAETADTFTGNAILKASGYARQIKLRTLADDSGLEVEALGGAPGVFSARYAGEKAVDAERIEKLLLELGKIRDERRRARFVCAMAVADEKGEIKFATEGVCNGRIAPRASGNGGFGYDPVFIPDGFNQTLGELSSETKQKISHRARAAEKIIRYLRYIYSTSLDQSNFRL